MSNERTNKVWQSASLRLVPLGILAIVGAVLSSTHSYPRPTTIKGASFAILGVILFLITAITFLNVLIRAVNKIVEKRVGAVHASLLRFVIRLVGYITILLVLLTCIHISITNILLGSVLIGIILSAAAQQVLANFFASVVIIVGRPYAVGQKVTLVSGGLGGPYTGKVVDIGFTHTKMRLEDSTLVKLPNATLLSYAAVVQPPKIQPENNE